MKKNCAIYNISRIIGRKWAIVILLELYKGNNTFSKLKRYLPGITAKMLSSRLKELEGEDLITKDSLYSLTASGLDLILVIKNLKSWALKWKIKNAVCSKTDCEVCEI